MEKDVFNLAIGNDAPIGCTVSFPLLGKSATCFSMAEHTNISAESYPMPKIFLIHKGTVEINGYLLKEGETLAIKQGTLIGLTTDTGCVYTEISGKKDSKMNQVLDKNEVLKLKDLLPYQEGKIVNMDLMSNDKMKLAIMAFGAGTGLDEHAAPGEALIFALDGEAIISYEGKDYTIHAGENFRFNKGGLHAVKAEKEFKMALLLNLGE